MSAREEKDYGALHVLTEERDYVEALSLGPDAYATNADPLFQHMRREDEVERQRVEEGRTGGGLKCPRCGLRALRLLDEERPIGAPTRLQCGACACGVAVRVHGLKDSSGIAVKEVAR